MPRVVEEMFVSFVGIKIYFLFFLGEGYMEELGNDWIMVHDVKSPKNRLKNIILKKKREGKDDSHQYVLHIYL